MATFGRRAGSRCAAEVRKQTIEWTPGARADSWPSQRLDAAAVTGRWRSGAHGSSTTRRVRVRQARPRGPLAPGEERQRRGRCSAHPAARLREEGDQPPTAARAPRRRGDRTPESPVGQSRERRAAVARVRARPGRRRRALLGATVLSATERTSGWQACRSAAPVTSRPAAPHECGVRWRWRCLASGRRLTARRALVGPHQASGRADRRRSGAAGRRHDGLLVAWPLQMSCRSATHAEVAGPPSGYDVIWSLLQEALRTSESLRVARDAF